MGYTRKKREITNQTKRKKCYKHGGMLSGLLRRKEKQPLTAPVDTVNNVTGDTNIESFIKNLDLLLSDNADKNLFKEALINQDIVNVKKTYRYIPGDKFLYRIAHFFDKIYLFDRKNMQLDPGWADTANPYVLYCFRRKTEEKVYIYVFRLDLSYHRWIFISAEEFRKDSIMNAEAPGDVYKYMTQTFTTNRNFGNKTYRLHTEAAGKVLKNFTSYLKAPAYNVDNMLNILYYESKKDASNPANINKIFSTLKSYTDNIYPGRSINVTDLDGNGKDTQFLIERPTDAKTISTLKKYIESVTKLLAHVENSLATTQKYQHALENPMDSLTHALQAAKTSIDNALAAQKGSNLQQVNKVKESLGKLRDVAQRVERTQTYEPGTDDSLFNEIEVFTKAINDECKSLDEVLHPDAHAADATRA